MTSRVQTLRSSVAGNRPTNGTRSPGELWVNFPDFAFGHIDGTQQVQSLLAVRNFSTLATYAAGDMVAQGGAIWTALAGVPPGPFTPSAWTRSANMNDVQGTYVPLAGGTMTGALLLNADPTANLGAATKQYVDAHVTGFLPITGGTVTGNLAVQGSFTASPANLNVTLSPTGTGKVIINSGTAGNIDNEIIGASTPQSGTFTNLNASNVNFTGGTIGSGVAITGVPAPSTTTPLMNGTAAAGTATAFSRGDHVHPSDTTKANVAGQLFTGMIGASGGWSLSTAGAFQFNGGGQFYAGSYGGNTVNVNNANLQSSSYIGMLGSTPNSFGANTSYIWGLAGWSGIAGGGGGMYSRSDRTDCYMAGWLWGTSSLVGTVSTNGSSVSYNSTSDGRLKRNIRNLTDDLDPGELLDNIRPVAFDWRARNHNSFEPGAVLLAKDGKPDALTKSERAAKGSTTGHGFIAQELIKVAPFAVHAPDDGEQEVEFDFEAGVHPWGVDFSKLVPYLVAEVQNLRRRIAQLEGR